MWSHWAASWARVQEEDGAAAGASKTKCGNPSSVAADASVAKDDYVKVAEDIAKDDGHGYNYGSYGPTDFDCSGLVWYALHQSGYKVGDTRFSTANEAPYSAGPASNGTISPRTSSAAATSLSAPAIRRSSSATARS